MAWFWTDDLAARLLAAGVVGDERIRDWVHHPVAVAGGRDEDPLDVGLRVLAAEEAPASVPGAA